MLKQSKAAIRANPDEWPVYTRDGKLSSRPGEVARCVLDASADVILG